MNTEPARKVCQTIVNRHLTGWKVKIVNRTRSIGMCNYKKKEITITKYLFLLEDPNEAMDTLLHEIAHAKTKRGVGHGKEWKKICRELGCIPKATTNSTVAKKLNDVMPEKKYNHTYECPNCYYRRTSIRPLINPRACPKCCNENNNGRYDERYRLVNHPTLKGWGLRSNSQE